jgi:hypothetical protein
MDKMKNLTSEIFDKATAALGGKKKSKLQMHIKPTDDNRFHVVHNHMGMEPMESSEHAPSSLKELLAHVEKHYSDDEKTEKDTPAVEKSEGEKPKE